MRMFEKARRPKERWFALLAEAAKMETGAAPISTPRRFREATCEVGSYLFVAAS
jgi:hypothetical protein